MRPLRLSPKNRFQQFIFSNENEIDEAIRDGVSVKKLVADSKVKRAYSTSRPIPEIITDFGMTILGNRANELMKLFEKDGVFYPVECEGLILNVFQGYHVIDCVDVSRSECLTSDSGHIYMIKNPHFSESRFKSEYCFYEKNLRRLFFTPKGRTILEEARPAGIDIVEEDVMI